MGINDLKKSFIVFIYIHIHSTGNSKICDHSNLISSFLWILHDNFLWHKKNKYIMYKGFFYNNSAQPSLCKSEHFTLENLDP